jgi:hypothetical protein
MEKDFLLFSKNEWKKPTSEFSKVKLDEKAI